MFTTADQTTTTAALATLKNFKREIEALRLHGRYALDASLAPAALDVIADAEQYCEALAAEIGADTFLGASGTPAAWGAEFGRARRRVQLAD